ncbi:hypothetical protein D917_07292 [Trichinella nativa]|uniref:Uncharacterized protein n=1 Tax=Trichinella nativa TaxID=6335 RepID=A0A1Y3EPX4_9BILA|nr:hypothetical protein D917_07292 [Trichinella nativa]
MRIFFIVVFSYPSKYSGQVERTWTTSKWVLLCICCQR